jgi:hypothetical protein
VKTARYEIASREIGSESPASIRALVHTVAQHSKENNALVRRQLLRKWYATWLLDCDTSVFRTIQQRIQ